MYWSYLCRNTGLKPKLLTFESGNDLKSLKFGYSELILDDYFNGFLTEYDLIFVSKYSPDNFPYEKEKDFVIEFKDFEKAKRIYNEYKINNYK